MAKLSEDHGVSLLDVGDDEKFRDRGRHFLRWMQPVLTGAGKRGGSAQAVGVLTEIESQIGAASRSGTRWARLFCIEVRENDGMSWTAESVRLALAKRFPAFKSIAVRNEAATDRLPVIADIVGRDRFMRRAVTLGLADEYPTFASWRSVLLLALAVALVFAKSLAETLLKLLTSTANSGPVTAIILLLLAVAAVAVIAQWLLANKPVSSRRRSEEGFRQKLSALPAKSEYASFIEELARDLTVAPEPRVVIIDNYDAVDELTQSVIARYFAELHAENKQSELWVVFEGETGDRLSGRALETWNDPRALQPLLYRQQFLSADERKSLAKIAGDESRATFSAVKSICRRGQAEDEWICNLLKPLASKYESPLALPYVFLLAMEVPDLSGDHRHSAVGTNVFFSWPWLESLTTEKSTAIRAAVLAAFFGKALTKSDVNSVERTMREKLGPLIVEANDGPRRTFAVTREAALHMFAHAGEHQLSGASTAKLFWAFALSQKKSVTKAFWTRRVIHHLLEVDPSQLPPELTRGVVLTELRNLALNMIDSSIRCCLFGELPELIRFTRLLIADYDPSAEASVKRLRKRALEAYHLTGAEEILREIIQSYELPEEAGNVRADIHPMLRLYAESVPLIPELRAVLEAYILGDDGRAEIPDAYDHALARACWLALLGAPFFAQASRNPRAFGSFDITDVRATINGIVDRVTARLSRGEDEDISTLDVSTLSFALWCRALMLDARVLEFLPNGEETLPVLWTPFEEGIRDAIRSGMTAAREFEGLVTLASSAVVVASLFLTNARRGGRPHFLATAMVNETCAIALAAVWLGHALVASGQIAVPNVEAELSALLEDVDGILGTSLAATAAGDPFASDGLRSSVHDLLRIATVVWRHFKLPNSGDLTALRSVHFGFVADGIRPDDDERQRPLLAEVEPLIAEPHFTGLAANLTLALCYRRSMELSTIHLSQAAHVARETLFGERLQVTLALITVLNSSRGLAEWDPLVEAVLRDDGGPSAVARFLADTADEELRAGALKLMNAADSATDERFHALMAAAVRERLASVADETLRGEIDSVLDLFEVERNLRADKSQAATVLQRWQDRKQYWTYARVLLELRRCGLQDAELRAEALQLLDRDPELDKINSWYHLALDMALDNDDDHNAAVEYVRKVVDRFESVESAETNMRAYRLLMVRSPENPAYVSGVVRAQRVKIKRDYNQRLPALIAQGKFFLIFTDHVEHMQIWGLPLDVPPQQYHELRWQSPEQRREWVRQWMAAGKRIPQPIVSTDGGIAVCCEFVILGTFLFSGALEQDEAFAPVRRALNDAAYAAMPPLLNEIGTLSRTPPEIRRLLSHYAASSTAESQA